MTAKKADWQIPFEKKTSRQIYREILIGDLTHCKDICTFKHCLRMLCLVDDIFGRNEAK